MTQALTDSIWKTSLRQIISVTPDDGQRTLAAMLLDIVTNVDDPLIGEILDAYAGRLLGETP